MRGMAALSPSRFRSRNAVNLSLELRRAVHRLPLPWASKRARFQVRSSAGRRRRRRGCAYGPHQVRSRNGPR